jgi:hypothetical protein
MPERAWNALKRRLGAEERLVTDDVHRLEYQERQRQRAARSTEGDARRTPGSVER